MGGDITIESVDDRKGMEEIRRTFTLLGKGLLLDCILLLMQLLGELHSVYSPGLKEDFQSDVFKVLAAILHLGNVEFKKLGDEKSSVAVSSLS